MYYREELFNALTAGIDGVFRDKSIEALVEVCRAARKEGYDAGLEDRNVNGNTIGKKIKEAYKSGLNDAWEAARTIVDCKVPYDFWELSSGQSMLAVLRHYSAKGAIEKIREYEEEQQKKVAEIKIGDEVENISTSDRAIVVRTFQYIQQMDVMWKDGSVGSRWLTSKFKKTGRHFPQIAEVIKQMQEDEA